MATTTKDADLLGTKVDHPDFAYGVRDVGNRPTFVFNRGEWRTPTKQQIAEYEQDRKIVEAHRGQMTVRTYQLAGKNQPFSEADCGAMQRAVLKALPDYRIADTWNGEGSFSFSVAVRRKA